MMIKSFAHSISKIILKIIAACLIIAIIFFVFMLASRFILDLTRKNSITEIEGKRETFANIVKEYGTGFIKDSLIKTRFDEIIFNSALAGIGEISDLSELAGCTILYEKAIDDSFMVHKLASYFHPVLFYYKLYSNNERLYLLAVYSTESKRGELTQDYFIMYEYTGITPADIIDLIPDESIPPETAPPLIDDREIDSPPDDDHPNYGFGIYVPPETKNPVFRN